MQVLSVKAQSTESRAAKMLREIFESGRPLLYVRSAEEQRVAGVLKEVASRLNPSEPVPILTWSLTEGMRNESEETEFDTVTSRGALDYIASYKGPAIFHLKDFHEPLRDSAEIRRRLRDIHAACLDRQKYVVITSPVRYIPDEVARSTTFVELRPPDIVELVDFLRDELRRTGQNEDLSDTVLEQLARALQGLTIEEARYGVRRAVTAHGRLGQESVPALLEEKRLLVNRSGVIEFIDSTVRIEQIGGLEGLKKWLLERQKLFQLGDSLSAEIVPKGVLMMGIPGCGKSLSVKAIGAYFGLPLYRIDMVEIFSGRHGKPEVAFVDACRMLEDMAPAVLWFDEIEMAVTATETGGEQGRIFAFFLTWMQEKARGLFVAATANRIDLLPAEMIRKGRFDEVFFVDLPLEDERIEIFKIHLERRGIDYSRFNIDQLRSMTTGWTGAEIEQCVVSTVTKAKLADREVTEGDLIKTTVSIVPLSRTMKEQIDHIRNWAFERAVRASVGRH
ncbi:MAG TPA: AAA family ATPase [Bryobacteraceae bacterium]|nr:AAA family ATPase [Bryobacteraceae bacterium]